MGVNLFDLHRGDVVRLLNDIDNVYDTHEFVVQLIFPSRRCFSALHPDKGLCVLYANSCELVRRGDYSMDRPVEHCPRCGVDLVGDRIPENLWHNYGPPYYWYRKIRISSFELDRTISWECPDCGHEWGRK